MNNKARERNEVIMELGILIQPIVDLVRANEPASVHECRIASAKVRAGDAMWRSSVKKLASFAPDVFMHTQFQKTSHVVEVFLGNVDTMISAATISNDLNQLQIACKKEVERMRGDFDQYLSEIPIEWEPEIFAANTPFTAYVKIKDAISTASSRLHYFDRYLGPNFFELFLRDTDRSIELRLVTTVGDGQYGTSGVRTVSDLAKKEFLDYKLIEVTPTELHDRNLIVDTNVFSLGPGTDRAGFALTNFNPSDSSPTAQKEFERIIGVGNVIHESQ